MLPKTGGQGLESEERALPEDGFLGSSRVVEGGEAHAELLRIITREAGMPGPAEVSMHLVEHEPGVLVEAEGPGVDLVRLPRSAVRECGRDCRRGRRGETARSAGLATTGPEEAEPGNEPGESGCEERATLHTSRYHKPVQTQSMPIEAMEDTFEAALKEAQRQGRVAFRIDEQGRKVYYLVLN